MLDHDVMLFNQLERERLAQGEVRDFEEKDYFKELWELVLNGVLKTRGNEFSFKVPIATEYFYYDASVTLFLKKDPYIKRQITTNLKRFMQAFTRMPSDITYTKQEACFREVGEKELEQLKILAKKGRRREEKKVVGYDVVVTVGKSRSSQIFNDRYAKGVLFNEKLLREHKELLRKITEDLGIKPSPYYPYFSIYDNYISTRSEHYVYFSSYGMAGLSTIEKRYGFALAMVELYKSCGVIKETDKVIIRETIENIFLEQEKSGQQNYKYKIVSSGLKVVLYREKEESNLRDW